MSFEPINSITEISTSGASPNFRSPPRRLRKEEVALLEALLSQNAATYALRATLRDAEVEQMCDGDMGSLRFVHDPARSMGRQVLKAAYVDDDGTPVSIAVNTDLQGDLFELDMWKVDFSPLRRFPEPWQIEIEHG